MTKRFFVHLEDVITGEKVTTEVGGYQRANQLVTSAMQGGTINATIEIRFTR